MNPSTAARALGIDFGTSNSTVGWWRPEVEPLIALEDGKITLPSVVFFNVEERRPVYGRQALGEYLEGYEGRLMRSLKSLLGSKLLKSETTVLGSALPFKDLLGLFIGQLKARGEAAAGQAFDAVYAQKSQLALKNMRYDIVDSTGIDRLFRLIEERAGHWLAMQVEDSKIRLTETERLHLSLERIEAGLGVELTRGLFEHAVDGLLERVRNSVAQLLASAGVDPDRVDTVFFTGGSSGIPALRRSVSAMLPNARHVEGNLFGSIGSGLAIEAKKRYG